MNNEERIYTYKITSESKIVLEIGSISGSWPLDAYLNQGNNVEKNKKEKFQGVIGLYNLGNTCYMNR